MILAGDVGGTKILLEVGELRSGAWQPALARRYASDAMTFAEALGEFLREWKSDSGGKGKIATAAFGVAGPRTGNKAKMTNRPWAVDGDQVSSRHGIRHVRVVNDLEASAYGIALLPAKEFLTVHAGRAEADAPCAVLGVGTGLGVAFLVPHEGKLRALPGEGGHIGFAPTTHEQLELWKAIYDARGRACNEDVVSGVGLMRIHELVSRRMDVGTPGPQALAPEKISAGALAGDPTCKAAFDLFIECIGSVAGDYALAVNARGGVFLTGGIVAKIAPQLKSERFAAAFSAKGAHSSWMKRIPVKAITSERLGVLGAARFASEL